ncbi:MAG: polyprenyl synthetase family protein [Actinomycetaceae bacterium]|nr:polyprenyl synthetase family protein [Actinomycetaceae bacterium]
MNSDALSQLEDRISADLARVEARLNDCVHGSRNLVDELTSHLSKAGGKRMRPMLALLCAQLGEPDEPANERVIKAATAVELTHLATLYHDDVMDSAPQRRGVPAAQHQWGNNRAILAGDILFARASKLVADLGARTIGYHAQTFERLCQGQLNETFGPEEDDDPIEFYIRVLADKTGSLINAAGIFGAWHSGVSDEWADAVAEYGERIGIAFQLADDVIDLTSGEEVSGKTPGTDLLEGVSTLPVLLLEQRHAAGTLDGVGADVLGLLERDLSDPAVLADVVDRLGAHDVIDETREYAQRWVDQAIEAIALLPDSVAKDALIEFAHFTVHRMH